VRDLIRQGYREKVTLKQLILELQLLASQEYRHLHEVRQERIKI
jgi:hypothetical protein